MIKPKSRLWNTRVRCAITEATEVCIFDHIRHRRRNEWRPILTKERECARLVVKFAIDSHPGQANRRLTRTNRGDVAIVHAREVTFEIEFDLAGDDHVRRRVEPFKVGTEAQAARSQMKLRRIVRTSVRSQKRQRKIISLR